MKFMGNRKRSTLIASACVLVLATACGTDSGDDDDGGSDAGSSGFQAPDLPMLEEIGDMEGEVNILAWPGYAEDGSTDPAVDWVSSFEEAVGVPGQRQVLRHVRRGRPADEDR